MTEREEQGRERFRVLPEPVRPDEWVAEVDTSTTPPLETDSEERARFLREAGGA
jgi:hypothetical protein